jgi:hypothetical protein
MRSSARGRIRSVGTSMKTRIRWAAGIAVTAVAATSAAAFAQTATKTQTFPLRDTAGLITRGTKAEAVAYLGREAVRLTVEGETGPGIALLPGTDFQDGVIEADLALRIPKPPGFRFPGFVGIVFRARPDAAHYEVFYLRPGNSDAMDQTQRNHAAQYAAEPGFHWYPLRRAWPSLYESSAEIAFETWTKVRIEVAGRAAKLFLNGSARPTLVVDGMKGEDLRGAVGLMGDANEEAYFSNVRITPAAPLDLRNGSDVAGSWEVRFSGDAGPGGASTMVLRRDAGSVSGTWSGPLGDARAVTGTWRNGYVELSFTGEWPKASRQGAPGPVTVYLAGWIDGDAGKGQMRAEGRSVGTWVAQRQK